MKLGDIVSLVRGSTYKSSLLSETDGPVLLGLGSIARDGGFKFGAWKHYPGPSDSRILLHPGDLYVSLKDLTQACSLLGAVARVPNEISVGRLTQDTVKLEFKAEVSEREKNYTYWSLRTPQYRAYCKARGMGTTNMSLSRNDFLDWEIPQPSTSRDRLIELLEDIERLATLNQRTNDYLFECCAAKMNDIVGVPSSTIKVDDCCELIYSGGTPSTKNPAYWNGDLPWLSSGETRSRFIIDTEKTITELGVMESSTKLAKTGDIVMASAGQGFTRGQTSMLFFDTYVNQSVVVMRPKKDYGAYLLLMLAGQYDNLRAWSDSTSTRGSMSGKLLKQFELPYFDANQAKELTEFAAPMFRMIENNMRESKVLAQARDVLLPKLMSGEIDLAKIEFPTQPNNHLSAD